MPLMGDGGRSRARLAACTLLVVAASVFVMPVHAVGHFVVTGRVMDRDGEPIQGATVEGQSSGLVATTDVDGRYRLDYLVPQSEYLVAAAPGRDPSTKSSYGLTQFEPVDFVLNLRLTMWVTPPLLRSTQGETVAVSVSTAWRDDLCVQMSPPGVSARTNVAYTQDGSGVTGTATMSHQFASALSSGAHYAWSWVFPCDAPNLSMGWSRTQFRVDGVGPDVMEIHPSPGAKIPEDRVFPSFRLVDISTPIGPVEVTLADLTTSETVSLPFTTTGSKYFTEAIMVRDGHSYRMTVTATDSLGNTRTTGWPFSGIAPVPTPIITDTAPYEYGERCETTAFKVINLYSLGSCLSEPSAVRSGALRLVHADVRGATDTVVATAGYDFMGAGIRYTVPRNGVVEATALFSGGVGDGRLCVAAFKGEKTVYAIKCAPISSSQVTIQFSASTGQALRIGGYLMPECRDEGTAKACRAASFVSLDQVTVASLGSS